METLAQSVLNLFDSLPSPKPFRPGIRRAPRREARLSEIDKKLAIRNALRYLPPEHHAQMAVEFASELAEHGRIYAYRFRPEGAIRGRPINDYEGACIEGKAIQVMLDNNLDFDVALYPYELVTYGETGQVCQNWMQYRLIKHYLQRLTNEQTLVIMSGHPLGLFRSHALSPRVIITNGLMIGQFDNQAQFNRAAALGVANYGQMTAGGMMYIGPQGIVHGTYNTLLGAGRLKLGIPNTGNLAGKLFVSSGLGGMSGAQGKAAVIAGASAIIAEVDASRIKTRLDQGWVTAVHDNVKAAVDSALAHQHGHKPCAIAFHGNIIDLLEYMDKQDILIDLLSDQTSCHAAYEGGYCPQGLTFEQRTDMLAHNPERFRQEVDRSLKLHFKLIQRHSSRGTYFFDYGNSFLKAVFDAGQPAVCKNGRDELDGFIYPSYVEDILGPELFDYGYGPFRWCCLSGKSEDLALTDRAAMDCIDPDRRYQDYDNWIWVRDANKNNLAVGTQCRILYQDALGRMNIALRFNQMVRDGLIGPVMLGRDHHDTGGTDSPFRETSNIKDGSNIMAEMAAQCFAGNAARGMSMIALHNGGGVGIGKAINGGFGMVLDGSSRVDSILQNAMPFDAMVGVARRSWARNPNAMAASREYNNLYPESDHITLPFVVDEDVLSGLTKDGTMK